MSDLIEDWVHTGRPIQPGVMNNRTNDTQYRERNMYYLGGTGNNVGGTGGQYVDEAPAWQRAERRPSR